jgi:hypothetical protein
MTRKLETGGDVEFSYCFRVVSPASTFRAFDALRLTHRVTMPRVGASEDLP